MKLAYKVIFDSDYQTINANKNMYTLKTITKRNNSFLYHIEVTLSDETKYVEKFVSRGQL